MTASRFPHVPDVCHLRSFLEGHADKEGDEMSDLLSYARACLTTWLKHQPDHISGDRLSHLARAEDAFSADGDIEVARLALQNAFTPPDDTFLPTA